MRHLKACLFVGLLVTVVIPASGGVERAQAHPHPKSGKFTGFARAVAQELDGVYREFFAKLEHLKNLDEENSRLRARVASLELELATLRGNRRASSEDLRAVALKARAVREGGVDASRTLASLGLPDRLLAKQPAEAVYEKAISSFSQRDYAGAARGLVTVLSGESAEDFETAQNFYLAATSLYELRNFLGAKSYFEKTLRLAHGKDLSFAPRALGWIALCEARLGRKPASQRVIQELIQKFPHSLEARRLNRHA